jgi:putative endopeptidase
MLELAGWDEPEQYARKIVELETRIAEASWARADSNDRSKTWNVTTLPELEASAPAFPWRAFLAGAGLDGANRFIVFEKTAFPKLAAIFGETPVPTLKAWLAFSATDAAAPYLSDRFRDARLSFRGGTPDRRRDAVRLVNDSLRDAVARQYMTKYFRPEARARVETMVRSIKAAMAERIRRLEWMSPQTKEAALQKLAAIRVGIGYPDRWRDDSALELREDDLYGNMRRLAAFEWRRELDKLRRPVDRDAWDMAPQAVGAQAAQPRLYMLFTAGLLQPPIFDANADPAVNFGGLGAVIGHEIGHFFDDSGWRIDATGARRSWWTAEDAAQFQARTEQLTRQLETYEASPGVRVDARRTLSEFMAHLEGLEVALDAYHAFLGNKPAPMLDGFTGDQRFFLAFAQTWKAKVTDEFWRRIEDQAPPVITINGVLRNMDEWYAAFDIQPSDTNYLKPEDRIRIW